ncbi:unnamed protein product [Angiostrongylus costaricensis]|uniref:Rad21_Rec8_N domain-containing protein n=1 Tax=Angiostrongylus costaricensis TaxID=334426 RepID=A0A0R3PZG0_ANGCS|nr:unnamed protein product [Angiostrongylus costaricensis]
MLISYIVFIVLAMFFSKNHLIGRDGKFALVCREILKFTPTGPGVEADRLSKFSLYLIGQLVYGTTVIFSRQVVIFEQDVRSVYESCKRLPMEIEDYDPATLSEFIAPRKRQRRSKLSIAEMNTDIDIDEVPESRFVHLARPSDITLFEPEPVIWQRPDIFHEDENQLPINFSKNHLSLSHRQVVDEEVSQRPSFDNHDHELVNNREPSPLRLSMDQAADGHRSAEETEFKPDITNISQVVESIKKLQQDYSALLKTKEELSVNVVKQKHPTVEQLLLPYPAYAGNRFPTECRQLYRSRFSDTLTYQEAMTERILDPINRGPASTLWRYRESSTETSIEKLEDKVLPGVAYCSGTPDRVRIGSREAEASTAEVQVNFLFSVGTVRLRITSNGSVGFLTTFFNILSGYVVGIRYPCVVLHRIQL